MGNGASLSPAVMSQLLSLAPEASLTSQQASSRVPGALPTVRHLPASGPLHRQLSRLFTRSTAAQGTVQGGCR